MSEKMIVLLVFSLLLIQETKTVFVDRVAVKVNDKIIMERELLRVYKSLREQALAEATGTELDHRLKEAWKDTVRNAEESLLLYEKAAELGYAYSRDDVLGQLTSLKESKGMTDEEFEQAIFEQTGFNLDELVDLRQREDSAQGILQSQVVQKIEIEDSEIAKYFEEHKAEFMQPSTYRIAEIVFIKDETNPSTSQNRGRECLEKVRSGLAFEEAAAKYSDSLSTENGGDLGLVKFGDLLGSIESRVKEMKVGDTSEILETPSAYFIIKLLELNPIRPKPLADVRADIVTLLREPRLEIQVDKYIEKLRAEFSVKVYVPEIPWYLEY